MEKIVLHSFEPVPGEEGEMAASPHGKRALGAVEDLTRIHSMDFDVHAPRRFSSQIKPVRRDIARLPPDRRPAHGRTQTYSCIRWEFGLERRAPALLSLLGKAR